MTKKIRQHNNKLFQEMLIIVKTDLLNNSNITILNNKIATTVPIQDTLKNIVIIQWYTIRHTINRLQVQRFTKINNRDIILFPI